VSGRSFHYDSNYRYSVLIPSIGWSFRPKNIRDNKRQILQLAWYNVFRDKSPNVVTNPDYSIINLRHAFVQNNTIDYLSARSNIEFSKPFGKIQFTGEARKLFPSGRQLSARVFLGKFLWHNNLNTQFFDFNLNRPSDYLFQYGYLGRSETTGVYSQQYIPAEGGFKSKFEQSTANDYMISLNTSMGIWKWFEVYGDVGMLKNIGSDAKVYFDSGIKLNLTPDYLELYFPIFSSNGFSLTQPRFATKIRFILYPGFKTLTSLFTRKWF
jgi:opacity protein-like surface antigen